MRYIVYENGIRTGEAECEIMNTKLKISASCMYFDGIKRLRMVDIYGNAVNISVLEPLDGKMTCSKTMSLSEVSVRKLSDISHFEAGENSMPIKIENDWRDLTMLTFPIEPCILDVCMENNDVIIINDEKRALAHEYDSTSELIFASAAAFLNIENINGKLHAVLCFDEYGFPKYCADI